MIGNGTNAEAKTSHGHERRKTMHQKSQKFLQNMHVPVRAMSSSALNGKDIDVRMSLHFYKP